MQKLGIAIIGSGVISEEHAESFLLLGDKVKMMAFTDVDVNRAKARAKQFNAPIAIKDYTELLNRDDIQIMSIVTPPFHHYQAIIDCLQAGKHVLCEKPVVLSLDQLEKIEKLVNETGLSFGAAFQWRFGTGIQQVKDLYDNNMFGKIIYASNNMNWYRDQEYFNVNWRNTWKKSGAGIVFTLGCHGLDALLYILGDVASVSAEVDALKYNIEIEDSGAMILRFNNKALGHVSATVTAHKQRSRMQIIGTKLEAISSNDPYFITYDPWEFFSVDSNYKKQVKQFLAKRNYEFVPHDHKRLIKEFVTAVIEKRQPAVNSHEIRRSLQVLTGVYKSNRLGKKVKLPIEKDDPFYFNLNPDSM